MKIGLFHSGGGDWVGLYVNGNLVAENHNLDEAELLRELSKHLSFEFEDVWSNDEELDRYGNSCPSNWNTILEME